MKRLWCASLVWALACSSSPAGSGVSPEVDVGGVVDAGKPKDAGKTDAGQADTVGGDLGEAEVVDTVELGADVPDVAVVEVTDDVALGDDAPSDVTVADSAAADSAAADSAAADSTTPDSTTADSGEPADGGALDTPAPPKCPGEPSCPCKADADCTDGLCVAHADGTSTCALPCAADGACAAGSACNGKGPKPLCIDASLHLCDPCSKDADCSVPGVAGAACVTWGALGSFCGIACTDDNSCPAGYVCQDGSNVGGGAVKQCRPAGETACTCSALAVKAGLSTACSVVNANGACKGQRACGANGLSACDGATPEAELCNGKDENCDGVIDEGNDCDDGKGCTIDTCTGGKCAYEILKGACNDGNACTKDDTCTDNLACVGAPVTCDDGNPCTKESCTAKDGCVYQADDGQPCDDGDKCTLDVCKSGDCQKTPAPCDDGNPCTVDTCDKVKGCVATADDTLKCTDNSACTTDACSAGKCVATPIVCDDGDKCTADSCEPLKGCVATPSATVCDDKNPCTVDVCDKAIGCSYVPKLGCTAGLPFSQPFNCNDATLADWKFDAPNNNVGWAVDASPNPPGFRSPGCSLNYNNGNNFNSGNTNSGNATFPLLDATAAKAGAPLVLEFWVSGSGEGGNPYDALTVEASIDDKTWTTLVLGTGGKSVPPPGNTVWAKHTVALSAYAGKKFRLRFRFDTVDSVANDGAGPFIDDVLVYDPSCSKDADCDDKNNCTTDTCALATGKCAFTAVVCDDKNPCTTDTCDAATGKCATVVVADGGACTDNDACTVGDVCKAGKCAATAKCDDKNACTVDSCDAISGACKNTNANDGTGCNDGNPCTTADVCATGKCVGKAASCSTLAFDSFDCGSQGWILTPKVGATVTGWNIDDTANTPGWKSAACSLNFNNGKDFACGGGQTKTAGLAHGGPYDAKNAKEVSLEFQSWADVGTSTASGKRWIDLTTDNWQSIAQSIALPNEVTVNKAWVGYKFDLSPVVAGKTFQLRFVFDSVGCGANAGTGWFIDDLRLTTDLPAPCSADTDCGDKNPCTSDSCVAGTCQFSANTAACDDGNACTTGDLCAGGACKAGDPAPACDDNNTCTTDACVPTKGCVFSNVANGINCTDGDACTTPDACTDGKCVGQGKAVDGSLCSDGNTCTSGDVCMGGKCAGKNACEDNNPCTLDSCTVEGGATKCANTAVAEGAACDDGIACTAGDSCLGGKCSGYQACSDLLNQPFNCGDPSLAGWSFSPPSNKVAWAVDANPNPPGFKSAACSLNYNNGTNFDSGNTNSGSATSPFIDASALKPGTAITLEFHSAGNYESGNYDETNVRISTDGVTFSNLKLSDGQSQILPTNNAWTLRKVDLTAYAGKKFKLQFFINTKDSVANGGSGPFIDDLVVKAAALACGKDADCPDDGNPCTAAICATGQCAQQPSAPKPCDDGNACTSASACGGGLCKGTAQVTCDDGYACTTDSCDPKQGCVFAEAGGDCGLTKLPYQQGFACNDKSLEFWQLDKASAGPGWAVDASPDKPAPLSAPCALNYNDGVGYQCAGGQAALDASARSPWFDATALAGKPIVAKFSVAGSWDVAPLVSLEFDATLDGKAWTTLKSIGAQDGWAGFAVNLSGYAGKKFRTRFRFSAPVCDGLQAGSGPFIDDFVVTSPSCSSNANCDDKDACTTDSCNTVLSTCVFAPKSCDDGNSCTADVCDANAGCLNLDIDGPACSDGNPCTSGDSCKGGKCASGKALVDLTACTDGDACTSGDTCLGGVCVAPVASCDDHDPCTVDSCATDGGCSHKALGDGEACDDGNACTKDDACQQGACVGGAVCDVAEVYATSFDCTEEGWSYSPAAGGVSWAVDDVPADPQAKSGTCSLNANSGKGAIDGLTGAITAASGLLALPGDGEQLTLSLWSFSGLQSDTAAQRFVEVLDVQGKALQVWPVASPNDLGKWVQLHWNLTAFAGQKVIVQVRLVAPGKQSGPGWFVDDLAVTAAKP
jgi:hypothetical protein